MSSLIPFDPPALPAWMDRADCLARAAQSRADQALALSLGVVDLAEHAGRWAAHFEAHAEALA